MRSKQFDILVVDDDDEDREIMMTAFMELHCQYRVTMYDGRITFVGLFASFKRLLQLPSLIVLDYNMLGLHGNRSLTKA